MSIGISSNYSSDKGFGLYQENYPKNPISSLSEKDIQESSWLKDLKPLADGKEINFLQECGDGVLAGLPLGYKDYSQTIPAFLDKMKKTFDFMRSHGMEVPYINLEKFEKCLALHKKIKEESTESLAEELLNKVKSLNKNESILIPGGYHDTEMHSMLYKLEKQKDGKFTFTIINTNANDYHDSIATGNKGKYNSHLSFKDIQPKKLFVKEFFTRLIDIQKPQDKIKFSSNDIYIGLVKYLEGKEVTSNKINAIDYKTPQRGESSAVKTLFAEVFHSMVGSDPKNSSKAFQQYKLINFFYRRESILEVASIPFDECNRTVSRYVSQIVQQWVASADKLLDANVPFSEQLLKQVKCTAIDINQKLGEYKESLQNVEKVPLMDFTLDRSAKISSNESVNLYFSDINDVNRHFDKTKIEKKESLNILRHSIDTSRLNASGMCAYLKELVQLMETSKEETAYFAIELIRELPIPSRGEDIWNEVPQDQIESIMESLLYLSQKSACALGAGFSDYYNKTKEATTCPEVQFFSRYVLKAIGDKLARRLPECLLEDGDKVGHYELLVFFFFGSAKTTFDHPKDSQRIVEVLKYFDPDLDFSNPPSLEGTYEKEPLEDEIEEDEKTIFFDCTYHTRFDKKESYKKYKTFEFFERFLKRQKTIEALKSQNLQDVPHFKKMCALYSENVDNPVLLPKAVHLLRHLCMLTSNEGTVNLSFTQSKVKDKEIYHAHVHRTNLIFGTYRSNGSLTSRAKAWQNLGFQFNGLNLPQETEYHGDQNKVMSCYLLEDPREAYLINTNPEDEVVRAYSYFTNLPLEKLEDRVYQQSFYLHLFKPGRLELQIAKEPEFIFKMLPSIQVFMNKFISQNKFQAAAFFAGLGIRCHQHMKQFLISHPHALNATQIKCLEDLGKDLKKSILDGMEDINVDLSTYSDVFNEFILAYESFPTKDLESEETFCEMAVDLLTANLFEPLALMENFTDIQNKKYVITRKKELDKKHLASIQKRLEDSSEERNRLLNGVMCHFKRFFPELNEQFKWEAAGNNVYVTEDKLVSIDTGAWTIAIEGKAMVGLPTELVRNQKFQQLFKEIKNIRAVDEKKKVLEIEDVHGISKLNTSYTYSIDMERTINGETYRYVEFPYNKSMKKMIDLIPIEFVTNHELDNTVWYKKETNDSKAHLMIQNHKTGKTLYVYLKKESYSTYIDYMTNSPASKRQLIKPSEKQFALFSKFVPLKKISFWAKEDDHGRLDLSEIEIPHLDLSFRMQSVEGEFRAMCRDVPGYFIAPNQNIEFIGKDGYSLVLTNDVGHKKVLVVKVNYDLDLDSPEKCVRAFVEKNGKGKYFVYDLEDKNGKQRLRPSSVSDALQLVSFLFLTRRFQQVEYYMKNLQALHGYSKKDISIIKSLIMDQNPHASANTLKLRLFILLMENQLKYSKDASFNLDESEALAQLYAAYLQNLGNNKVRPLSIEDEKFILHVLDKSKALVSPFLIQRINYLLDPQSIKAVKGTKEAIKLPEAQKLKTVGEDNFFILFKYSEGASLSAVNWNEFSCMTRDEFEKNIPRLYQMAKTGSIEVRQRLKNTLDLMEGGDALSSQRNIAYSCLIKKMCDSPKGFPDIAALKEASTFVYRGGLRENDKGYYSDKWGKQREWEKNRKNLFNKIVKSGKNSRAVGIIGKVKAGVKMLKESKYTSPANAAKLQAIEPSLPSVDTTTKNKLQLDDSITAQDKRWDQFFAGLFEKDKNLFEVKTIPVVKPVKNQEVLPEGKKKTLIENLEKFYQARPDNEEQYIFNVDNEDVFFEAIENQIYTLAKQICEDNRELAEKLQNERPDLLDESFENAIEIILSMRRMKIELLASKFHENSSVKDHLARLSRKNRPFNLNQLIALFEKGTKEAYQASKFSEEQYKLIDKEIGLYGIDLTRCLQLKQVFSTYMSLKNTKDPAEIKVLHQRFGEQIKTTRKHLSNGMTDRSREYLRYEMQEGIIFRDLQIKVLEALTTKERLQLLQTLGTGSGKTAVLSPVEQWMRRKNKAKLLFNVWPNQHYAENKKLIRSQVIENYEQRSDAFDFNRESNISPDFLFFMYKELLKAISEGRQLNTTPESLQNFELRFLEVLFDMTKEGIQYPDETLPLFQKILKLLKNGEIHVDEGHKSLSPRREVNFTIGDPTSEKEEYVLLITEIYQQLISHPELKDLVKLKSNEQNYLSESDYEKIVVPTIAKVFATKFGIAEADYPAFLEYVSMKTAALPDCLSSHPQLRSIALLRGELVFILKETLAKNTSVHYGPSQKNFSTCEYAKPYDANDSCVESAEYDNTTETINKTYQTYLYKRLTLEQYKKLIYFLRASIEEEMEEKPVGHSIKDTEAHKFYVEHFPANLANKALYSLTDKDLKENLDALNAMDTIIFYYVNKLIVPQIKKYSYTLKSDAQNLRSMFKDITTLTATPGSVDSYGFSKDSNMDDKILNYGNDSEVLNMLNKKCSDQSQFQVIPTEVPSEILDAILQPLEEKDTNVRMITDVGALFKGLSNLTVAKKILQKVNSCKGVVFYDNAGNLMVLERDGNKIIPLKESLLKPEERMTYCDNKHMFGADIKQSPSAVGICTFGLHNDLDDMLQGVGRLREFLKDQNAIWVATQSTMQAIDKDYGAKESYFHVICDFAVKNQEQTEEEKLFRSLKQQMRNEIRVACMQKLIHADMKNCKNLFIKFSEVLVSFVENDPLSMYGEKQEVVSGLEALTTYKNKLVSTLERVKEGFSKEEYQMVLNNLSGYEKKFQDFEAKNKIPKEVNEFNGQLGTESEIQIQVETQTEVGVEPLKESTEGLHNRKKSVWPEKLDIYSNWAKPTSLKKVMKKTRPSAFDMASLFKDRCFIPTRFTAWIKKDLGIKRHYAPKFIRVIAATLHVVVATVNGIAFAILGLPIYIVLGLAAVGIEAFKAVFMRNRKVYEEAAVSKYGMKRAKRACRTKVALYPLEEIIAIHPEKDISKAKEFFKSENGNKVLFTNNLLRKVPESDKEVTIKALGKEQKPILEVLVIEEMIKGKKQYTMIAGDQSSDAKFFRKKLAEDKVQTDQSVADKRTRKICLYDLRMGIVQNGKNPVDEIALSQDPDFLRLLVQVKLYNADVKYNDKQENTILKMANTKEKRALMQAFLKRSLIWRDQKAKAFSVSRINKTLNKKTVAA